MAVFFLAQQAASTRDMILGFLPMIAIVVIFYFLLVMPARKRQKKLDTMIANLKNGDRVITTGGIYGTIAGIKEQTFHLKVSDQTKIEISKNAIAGLQMEEKQG
jgi:preprotein translocase subunit YajC